MNTGTNVMMKPSDRNNARGRASFRISYFGFRPAFGLRISAFGFLLLALSGWCASNAPAPAAAPAPKPAATLVELQRRLADQIAQPQYAAAFWGIKVVSLDTSKILFEHNPQKLFSPASNSKLYTVALALDRLGADYRIKTSLYAKAKPNPQGVLEGDLIVYGRGDPTINEQLHDKDIFNALQPLVSALTNAGVKRITGDLVGDTSFFRGPEFGSGWEWEDLQYYYGAEISALTIRDNTLQVAVKPGDRPGEPCKLTLSPATGYLTLSNRTETVEKGARRSIHSYRPLDENMVYVSGRMPMEDPGYTDDVTLHNPAGLFVSLFKEAMARHGIEVSGRLRTVNCLDGQTTPTDCSQLVELGSMESQPLRDIAREVLKPSQNLYTDLLLAQVGERTRNPATRPEETSENLGLRELNKFLSEVGIPKGAVLFEEGSGLGRDNLATPNATVTLLQYMDRHACGAAYKEGLPIAGVDGTLRNRMKGTPAAGNLRAKTGTLRWAVSLSGYVTTAAGERLVFSLMLNRCHNPGGSSRAGLDAIAVQLASFTGRSSE